ncbi:sulfurtransferase [Thiomonas bhubaneswarensis]|uniref:3-mercaptopyruvate sulfurtransferase SseA, contains two rhodanese domains n=1 Tax=Thiomonas bhubaneswarensis TaxID=339866 RepID=A0A0K6HSS7_9BURK|nr:rhodanese-like domain-containing protein [Thiomonas bhubaneswarensis]CUA93828.1 3-mercaptopyruvate sulfurtransferase SseA, contains two rhodanese domains [Thiomonas bhubaneswarensis]
MQYGTKTPRRWAWALVVALAGWACVAQAAVLPGPLVNPPWLNDHAKEVQIVDIRDSLGSLTNDPKFSTVKGQKVLDEVGGHIPDALSVNFWGLRQKHVVDGKTVDFMLPTAKEFQESMQAVQLEPNKPIVIVPTGDDATSLQEAAFFAWELQVFGVPAEQIAILNGGMHAWISAGYAVDTDAIAPMTSSKWQAKAPDVALLATTEQVQAAQRTHGLLLDARPLAQFAGLERTPVVPKAGRLAGASPLPAELLYRNADDGSWRFLSAQVYRKVLAGAGMHRVSPGIVYCNTGQYAAGAWFVVHRIMGVKGLREYPGGMNEWEQRGLPVEAF